MRRKKNIIKSGDMSERKILEQTFNELRRISAVCYIQKIVRKMLMRTNEYVII
jgi:hypothetical protein